MDDISQLGIPVPVQLYNIMSIAEQQSYQVRVRVSIIRVKPRVRVSVRVKPRVRVIVRVSKIELDFEVLRNENASSDRHMEFGKITHVSYKHLTLPTSYAE